MTKKPCIVCGTPSNKTRCPAHSRRDHQDENIRRRLLAEWISTHGFMCAGAPELDHPPHPSTRLSVDHLIPRSRGGTLADGYRIVCQTINSTRGASPIGDPQ